MARTDSGKSSGANPSGNGLPYKRIATEEAFATPELLNLYRKLLAAGIDDPGFNSLWGFYLSSPSERPRAIIEKLQYLDERRVNDMNDRGIDMQVLSLTGPGVQIFDAPTAAAVSRSSNDQLSEAIAKHPTRLAGIAAIAPHNPQDAAKELERAVTKLGLKGAVINSHTHDEYLDDQKFWDIFAAAEALDVPIYIHPQGPSRGLISPLLARGLDGAIFGFGVDVGMHTLAIITSGAFDRFPKLQLMIGHMGEALPYWMYRLDYMHRATVNSQRYAAMQPLKRKVSDYLKDNVYVTNSGVAWAPAIQFAQQVLGVDRVLYAMDYPYQSDLDEVSALEREPGVSVEVLRKFYQTNAERAFKL